MSKSNLSLGSKAWAERINSAWQSSVDGILKVGQLLAEAKSTLDKGAFNNMIANELIFTKATASRLLSIGQDHRLVSHAKLLPPHWYTLYELSRLSDDEFQRAIEAKIISPDMERSDIPKEPRNLSGSKRSRVIEYTATEVEPAELPVATEQPSVGTPANFADAVATVFDPPKPITPERQPKVFMPKVDQSGGNVTSVYEGEADEPEPEVQPFGSGDTVTLSFLRNRPDVNFWQALVLALGEWTKLGSTLDGLAPSADTEKLLSAYDLTKFVMDLDVLIERRNAA